MTTAKQKADAEKEKITELTAQAEAMISAMELKPEDYDLTGDSEALMSVITSLKEIEDTVDGLLDDLPEVDGSPEKAVVVKKTLSQLQKEGRENFARIKKKKAEKAEKAK